MRYALKRYAFGIDFRYSLCIITFMISADQLRQARASLNESQATFGRRFGVDQSTIHRWETDGPPTYGPAPKLLEQFLASQEAAE